MRELIGKPWAVPCDPPNTFDCWELVLYVRNKYFGIKTPSVVDRVNRKPSDRSIIKDPSSRWEELDAPEKGAIARIGRSHVGVYLGAQGIIHASASGGVRVDIPSTFSGEDISYWELCNA